MWEFLARQILGQALKKAGKAAIGVTDEANGPEVYADRIKRDFHLGDYADAWALYDSDRAYWEQYYHPLPSPDRKSEIVRDSAAAAGVPSRNNVFEYGFPEVNSPQPPIGQALPPRRTSTQFMPPDSSTPVGGLAGQIAASLNSPAQRASPWGPLSLNDAYLEYRRRLDANQSQASTIDNSAPAAPLVPSNDANLSGGLPGRIAAMASVAPRNPTQPAPPSPVLGIFSGKPMPEIPIPPLIWDLPDDSQRSNDDDEDRYTRWRRSVGRY